MKASRYDQYWIQLEFKDKAERDFFAKGVSYDIPGAKFSSAYKSGVFDGKKSFLTPANKISAGVFKSIFTDNKLVYNTAHQPLEAEDIPLLRNNDFLELRGYQIAAINKVFEHRRLIINAIMGSGKTLIAAASISYHLSLNPKNKALFICYDKNILDQTYKKFLKYGLKDVTKFGDGVKDLTGRIVVATIQSLSKIKLPKKVLKDVSICFVDEAHHSKARTSKLLLSKLIGCEYYIGLTATVFKPKSLELAELTAVTGPVLFEYGFKEAVEDNNIVPVKCFFVESPKDVDVKAKVFHRKHYQSIWEDAVENNESRHGCIRDIVSTLIELLDTTQIVMVDRTNQGTLIAQCLNKHPLINVETMFGLHSIVQREMKKESLGSNDINSTNTIVSTVIGEGIDFDISPVVAINASGRKSFIRVIQFLGRLTRQNEKFGKARVFIDLLDGYYHPMLKSHSKERIEACRNVGCEVEICDSLQDLLVKVIKHFKENK